MDGSGGRAVLRRLLVQMGIFVPLAVGLISLYLSGLLRLEPEHWRGFAQTVGGALLLVFPAMVAVHWPVFRRIRDGVDALAAEAPDPAILRSGFAAVSDFPRYWFVWGLLWWGGGGALVAAGMALRYEAFGAFQAGVVVAATLSGACVVDLYYYLSAKRLLAPACAALAARLDGPDERRELVRPVTLRTKLLLSMTALLVVSMVYASFLSQVRAERAAEARVNAGQRRLVEAVASGDVAPGDAARHAARYGLADRVLVLDPATAPPAGGGTGPRAGASAPAAGGGTAPLPADALVRLRAGGAAGQAALAGGDCLAWARLPDGRIAVAWSAASTLRAAAGGGQGPFAALVLLATLTAVGGAWLLARDVGRSTDALTRRARRVAAGDLTGGDVLESEDELGELARDFEIMEASLAATVAEVAAAADRMQAAAGDIATAGDSVARVTEDQSRGVGEATASMDAIGLQIRDISGSAESLSGTVHAVTSAIFELDATGGELNESASALSAHLGEVSAAIEELLRSIGQVAQNADGLARAAEDASSSMTETARSVSEVDANSGEMARLSERVVELADRGRERVRETLEGMHAIQESTGAAREVITRLAGRADAMRAIVDVIDEVADETGLLALNAAIIAAQAGEHGRGFSVVADEITSLAERVLDSTKEIGGLIQAVQGGAHEANEAVERGARRVEHGVALASDAGTSLESITEAARDSGSRVQQIAASVREQTRAVEHVSQLMERVRMDTEHIRQAIWEQGSSTNGLRQGARTVGDVSDRVRSTTEEQVSSSGHIRESVQSIREAVDRIDQALRDQTAASQAAAEHMGRMAEGARSNAATVTRLEEATRALRVQAEDLRTRVRRFRFDGSGPLE